MELQRILAKDSRTAMEQVHSLYGKDALVVSNKRAKDKTELIVAVDLTNASQETMERMQFPGDEHKAENTDSGSNFDQVMESKIFKTIPMPKPNAETILLTSSANSSKVEFDSILEEREKLKSREIVDLVKQELAMMRRELKLSQQADAWTEINDITEELRPLIKALNDTGMPIPLRTLIADIINKDDTLSEALDSITATLGESLEHTEILENMSGIHILMGSSGSGKTLMAARIARQKAMDYGEDEIAIISFNDLRFGAWHQAQLLSSQVGVEIYRSASLDALDQLLQELGPRKLIIIDTPGVDAEETINTLTKHLPTAKKHLVVGADASEGSVNRYLDCHFESWASIILSRLEKGTFPWPVINALLNKSVPLSLVSATPSATENATSITGSALIRASLDQLKMSFV